MGDRGFSLLEAVVATALILAVTAAAIALVEPNQAGFATELERADMQQRLRVAAGTLSRDLVMAGAGAYQGANRGALAHYFAPVRPYRHGLQPRRPGGDIQDRHHHGDVRSADRRANDPGHQRGQAGFRRTSA